MTAVEKAGLGAIHALVEPLHQALSLVDALAAQTEVPVAELQALLDGVRAQRAQIHALQTQLTALDRQLEAVEGALAPPVGWAQQWIHLQQAALDRIRGMSR